MNLSEMITITENLAADLRAQFAPKGSSTSERSSSVFATRVLNDGSQETDEIIMEIKRRVRELNKATKGLRGNSCFRIVKRGRKPVNGVKYSYGGTVKLCNAQEIDLYICTETKW